MFTRLLKVQLESDWYETNSFCPTLTHGAAILNCELWVVKVALIYRPAILTTGDVTDDVACLELGKNPTVELLLNATSQKTNSFVVSKDVPIEWESEARVEVRETERVLNLTHFSHTLNLSHTSKHTHTHSAGGLGPNGWPVSLGSWVSGAH